MGGILRWGKCVDGFDVVSVIHIISKVMQAVKLAGWKDVIIIRNLLNAFGDSKRFTSETKMCI